MHVAQHWQLVKILEWHSKIMILPIHPFHLWQRMLEMTVWGDRSNWMWGLPAFRVFRCLHYFSHPFEKYYCRGESHFGPSICTLFQFGCSKIHLLIIPKKKKIQLLRLVPRSNKILSGQLYIQSKLCTDFKVAVFVFLFFNSFIFCLWPFWKNGVTMKTS